jgi:hypothetical protein
MDGSSPRVLRDERLVRGTLLGGCTLGFGGSKSKYSALRRLFVCPYDPAADGSPVGRLLQLHHSGRGVDARVRRAKRALHLQPPRGHWARRLALLLALVHQPREALAAGGRVVLAHSRQALPSRGIRALCREPRDFVRKCPLCTLLTAVLSGRGGGRRSSAYNSSIAVRSSRRAQAGQDGKRAGESEGNRRWKAPKPAPAEGSEEAEGGRGWGWLIRGTLEKLQEDVAQCREMNASSGLIATHRIF